MSARGYDILEDLSSFGVFVTKLRPGSAAAAAAALGGAATAAAQAAALQSADGIEVAAADNFVKLVEPVPANTSITDAPGSPGPRQQPGVGTAAAQCTWPDALNADYAVGLKKEGRSYGIRMVQADAAEVEAIADKYKSKVLYCVLDTGIDATNQEFTGVGKC